LHMLSRKPGNAYGYHGSGADWKDPVRGSSAKATWAPKESGPGRSRDRKRFKADRDARHA
jgi:hypothetical protein